MDNIVVTGFRWIPPFAQGVARDLRVRWALEEAGHPFEVDLIAVPDRYSESHRAKNPFGMTPAFEADGRGQFESGAILYRIAETSEILMPRDPDGRADTLTWMFAALNTVEPPLDQLLVLDFQHGGEEWAKLRRPGLVEAAHVRLSALAAWLEGREYLIGRFTAADILMTTVLRLARHTDLVNGYRSLQGYVSRLEARPAFQRVLNSQMAAYAANEPIAA